MPGTSRLSRAMAVAVSTVLLAAGLTTATIATTATAQAATKISTKYLLNHLTTNGEHTSGYARSKFTLWTDADHDGCDTRDEVLIAEATTRPHIGARCALTGGRWSSSYDGVTTTNPSTFDIDHLVPLNEAWQSGAWKWSPATRMAYANDLGYRDSLLAVSAHAHRSKGDREPQHWMPERKAYACAYVSHWLAVKWRWHLGVNTAERSFLTHKLAACGWPSLTRPSRPSIALSTPISPPPPPAAVAVSGVVEIPYQFDSFAGPLPRCGGINEFATIQVGTAVVAYTGTKKVATGSVTSCRWVNTGSRVGVGGADYNYWSPYLSFTVNSVPNITGLSLLIGSSSVSLGTHLPSATLRIVACDQYTAALCAM